MAEWVAIALGACGGALAGIAACFALDAHYWPRDSYGRRL